MVTLEELTIETVENPTSGGWTATSTAYPAYNGYGDNEEEAKQHLVDAINEGEGPEEETESTEG